MKHLAAAAVFLLLGGAVSSRPAAPPPLTPEQSKRIAVRDRLFRLADQLSVDGKPDEAVPLVRKALAIDQGVLGGPSAAGLVWLRGLAGHLESQERFKEALEARQERLQALRRLRGADDWRVTDARLDLEHTRLLARLGKPERQRLQEARQLNARILQLGEEGKLDDALPLAEKALKLAREVLGEKHPGYASILSNLAALRHERGEYREALPLYRQALKLRQEVLGERHPDTVASLNNLASLYQDLEEYRLALPLRQQALRLLRDLLGPTHLDYVQALNNLAALHRDLGEYQRALPLLEQALSLRLELLGERHPDYAHGLNNLALLHQDMGAFRLAQGLFLQSLRLTREVHGEDHPDHADTLNHLALLFQTTGEYRLALPFLQQVVKTHKALRGGRNPAHVAALGHLAALYQDMGEYRQALPLAQEAVKLARDVHGEKHLAHANSLAHLARIHQDLGEHAKALPLYRQALERVKEVRAPKHLDYAHALTSLARAHQALGEHKQALPLLRQALRLREEEQGDRHPAYAASLNNLALQHEAMGEPKQALPFAREALRLIEQLHGELHPDYATGLSLLAGLYHAVGDDGRGLPLAGRSLALSRRYLEMAATSQSVRQPLDAARLCRSHLDELLRMSADRPDLAAVVHDEVLAVKAAGLIRQRLYRLLAEQTPAQARGLAEEFVAVSRQLATLAGRQATPATQQARTVEVERLSRRQAELEARLSARSEAFRRRHVRSADVQRALPADAALIDLIAHADRLTAFVLRRQQVVRIELGRLGPIEKALTAWREQMGRPEGDKSATALRRLLWEPLLGPIGDARLVLVAPDGALAGLPFAALPGDREGTYLVEERAIATVPVAQLLPELLTSNARRATSALLAVGDVDFDAAPGPTTMPGIGIPPGLTLKWPRLPGTVVEGSVVAAAFARDFGGAPVTALRGAKASKEVVQRLLGEHTYAHLATHAFFAPARLESALTLRARLGEDTGGWDPLLLSGIVLSGANKATGPDRDGGILTALEVADMDLRKCRLVTLSGCDPAPGAGAGGEGVLGLQRAFQTAGARSTLTTLWSAPDAATSVLVEQFYKRLWGNDPVSKVEALRQAQLFVLRNPDKVIERNKQLRGELGERDIPEAQWGSRGPSAVPGKSPGKRSPESWWAGFVLAGDWR